MFLFQYIPLFWRYQDQAVISSSCDLIIIIIYLFRNDKSGMNEFWSFQHSWVGELYINHSLLVSSPCNTYLFTRVIQPVTLIQTLLIREWEEKPL